MMRARGGKSSFEFVLRRRVVLTALTVLTDLIKPWRPTTVAAQRIMLMLPTVPTSCQRTRGACQLH